MIQSVQASLEQVHRIARVMYAQTSVFVGHIDPVVKGERDIFWRFLYDRMSLWTVDVKHTLGDQEVSQFVEHRLDLGLHAIEVEILGTLMAFLAGRYVRLKEVAAVFAHMAGDAGIFQHAVMRARTALNTGAGSAKEHRALRPVVRTPMAGDARDYTVLCFGERAARLVAVDAQVAISAFVGYPFYSIEGHGLCRHQREVSLRISGVDLVTGAAILACWMGIALFDLFWSKAGSNTFGECTTGVASCAG